MLTEQERGAYELAVANALVAACDDLMHAGVSVYPPERSGFVDRHGIQRLTVRDVARIAVDTIAPPDASS